MDIENTERSQAIWIAEGNIVHFHKLLMITEDTSALKMLKFMLTEERDKLTTLRAIAPDTIA